MTGGQLVGGYRVREDHHKDPRIKEIAAFAVQQIQAKSNQQLELVKIVSVQTQVVAGMNYKFILDAATQSQDLHTYEATVYEPLGNQDLKLSDHRQLPKGEAERSVDTASESNKPALLGASASVDPTSPDVKHAANFAAEQLSQQSNSLTPFKVVQVLKARTRTEAGVVFELELKLARDKADEQIVRVEVQKSLGNQYTLSSSKTLES